MSQAPEQLSGDGHRRLETLATARIPSDLTPTQRGRLERRGRERRRITTAVFTLRVKAVLVARTERDRRATIGALEDLASACLAWASHLRKTGEF